MQKLAQLRAAIVAAIPDLATNPDRLMIWADKGRIATRRTPLLGYEWRYRANVLVEGFAGSADSVMIPLLIWLRDAQPDLVQDFVRGDEAVKFEAHVLDGNTIDLLLELELSDPVRLSPRDAGGFDAIYPPEPSADDELLGLAPAVPLDEIWLQGERILPR
jgi:hypothetical protein